MHIGIVGGRLQGLEAAYLARQAGYQVTVFDQDRYAPALGLAQVRCVGAIQQAPQRFKHALTALDVILPALEDDEALGFIRQLAVDFSIPVLFDPAAYAVSSSKVASNAFMAAHHIPIPAKWPLCRLPVVVKPSCSSGSHGVQVVRQGADLERVLAETRARYGDAVAEAYQEGSSLSLEVIGHHKGGTAYTVTELEFDAGLDCKRVYAPSRLEDDVHRRLILLGLKLQRLLDLNGLMDVEAIADPTDGGLAVLEIDARFPSQTPMAVFHATGINLVQEWVQRCLGNKQLPAPMPRPGCALLEHLAVCGSNWEVIGETRLLPWDRPQLLSRGAFYGADVAITDYRPGKSAFKSTVIFSAAEWPRVMHKRSVFRQRLRRAHGLGRLKDPGPCTPQLATVDRTGPPVRSVL